eukprot:15452890-Alexandrium_andersonii.AAC.1
MEHCGTRTTHHKHVPDSVDSWRPQAVSTLCVMLSRVLHYIVTCLSCRKRAGPNEAALDERGRRG